MSDRLPSQGLVPSDACRRVFELEAEVELLREEVASLHAHSSSQAYFLRRASDVLVVVQGRPLSAGSWTAGVRIWLRDYAQTFDGGADVG